MRYYQIDIMDKDGKTMPFAAMGNQNAGSLASHIGERFLPGCAQIEFDVLQTQENAAGQGSWLKIWGPTLKEISSANDMHLFGIVIKAGFKKGLPLAKPEQAGVICAGSIEFPYGNWMGTTMMIEMAIKGSTQNNFKPGNFVLDWPAGTQLSAAIGKALRVAFSGIKVEIGISDQLKLKNDELGAYPSLQSFAEAVLRLTQHQQFKGIKTTSGGPYAGVKIVLSADNKIVKVSDDTMESTRGSMKTPILIAGEDLIGQLSWMGRGTISMTTPLRADIAVGDYVKLPDRMRRPFIIVRPETRSDPNVISRFDSTFKGNWHVKNIHHVGNSRSPMAAGWATIFTLVQSDVSDTNVPVLPTEPAKPEAFGPPAPGPPEPFEFGPQLPSSGAAPGVPGPITPVPGGAQPPGNFSGQYDARSL